MSTTFTLETLEVMCPRCRAEEGHPCTKLDGTESARSHTERLEFRNYFIDKATGDTATARWWRWKLRNEGPSRPKQPHGTMAAYERHRRNGEEACDECKEAARTHWAARSTSEQESA